MRAPTAPQSHFRYPLNRVFGSEGAVRVLRELARHGGELSVPALVEATRLSAGAVRAIVGDDLAAVGIVERVGSGRSVLYRLHRDHPLRGALEQIFEEEDARRRRVLDLLATAARETTPDVLAVWVYGSVARGEDAPGSDLDVALVLPYPDPNEAADRYRAAISPLLDREHASASVLVLSAADIDRLAVSDDPWWRNVVADALPVLGPPPAVLAQRLRANTGGAGAE
jgi:predicted nucleotidyltransferase